jgi:serine/threonine protein kinase
VVFVLWLVLLLLMLLLLLLLLVLLLLLLQGRPAKLWIVMELCNYGTLDDVLRSKRYKIDPRRRLEWMRQIASGMVRLALPCLVFLQYAAQLSQLAMLSALIVGDKTLK